MKLELDLPERFNNGAQSSRPSSTRPSGQSSTQASAQSLVQQPQGAGDRIDPFTGEALHYAGFWVRFATFVIDSVCVLLFVSVPLFLAFGSGHWELPYNALTTLPTPAEAQQMLEQLRIILTQILAEYAVLLVLYAWFWIKYLGTPGKLLLGLQVVDDASLGPLSIQQSVVRFLGYFVSSMAGCLGFIWVGIDKRKQGFHDMMAHSLVVYRRPPNNDL